jgi:tetratricopeptide (TPR) repeat protein
MLKPKKKITKKDLKEDQLVTTYFKATEFFYQNKKYVSWVVAGLVVIVVAIVIYANNQSANSEKATTALGNILPYYERGDYQTAINGVPEKNILGLKEIAGDYGSTNSGNMAKFYLANAYFFLSNYDEALKYFEEFSSSYPLLRASALAGIGGCYEGKGDHKAAAEYFEKAASKAPEAQLSAEYLNRAARDYGLAGKKDRAIELLKRLKKDYPSSSYAREADRWIAEYSG